LNADLNTFVVMGGAQGRRNGQHESLQRNQVNLSFRAMPGEEYK